jgi:acyl-homoserine-lactone acylase
MELADRILDELLSIVGESGGQQGLPVVEVLKQWDRQADAESRGGVLFEYFWNEYRKRLGGKDAFRVPWDEGSPMDTPRGLAEPEVALESLIEAGRLVEERYGEVGVRWGDVYRIRRGDLDLPASGGPGGLGVFRVLFFGEDEDGKQVAAGGDSFMAAVEFSEPVRARVLTVTGASSDPESPHYADQMALFARKQLRPAWLTRKEVEAHLEKKEVVPGQ